MLPAAVIRNIKTGKFHAVWFRRAPAEMARDANQVMRRYSSRGYGRAYDTLGEAREEIDASYVYWDCGEVIDYDPNSHLSPMPPAIVKWFDTSKFDADEG